MSAKDAVENRISLWTFSGLLIGWIGGGTLVLSGGLNVWGFFAAALALGTLARALLYIGSKNTEKGDP